MPVLIFVGGLMGAAGVALSAYAAHVGGEAGGANMTTAAQFLLFHAPLFVALGLAGKPGRIGVAGAGVLGLGIVLFCGDLVMRHFADMRLFPMAAPTGGMAMILGWVLIAVSGLNT